MTEKRKLCEVNSGVACWLSYRRLKNEFLAKEYKTYCENISAIGKSVLIDTAVSELKEGILGMLGIYPRMHALEDMEPGILIISGNEDGILAFSEWEEIGDEGFIIKKQDNKLLIAGKKGRGVLYGIFAFLRCMQMEVPFDRMDRIENPSNMHRMVNQWDNMDGTIERGYAGKSVFYKGNRVVEDVARIRDYARLLASIQINGIVLNNVNVHFHETRLITKAFLPDVARVASIFREYGITVYISVNYSSPIELGGLDTADPLEDSVRQWWHEKAEEIYQIIPDFGGFLVKADSEFRPGPFTYGRDHAEGANMLARALKPYGGIVIWRCFVYNCRQDWRDKVTDRANAAYDNFMPLDGKFLNNVVLQIKNGPMDFQVREPVSPLFGGLEKTNQMLELQITQEYTGQQKHVCYLVPQWKEVLDFDTYAKGKGTTVNEIIGGRVFPQKVSGMAAVSNIGDDRNWTGHILAQANLYGYGRLAWNPDVDCEQITREWVHLTFSGEPLVMDTIKEILHRSWETYESYTSPLGIGWMVNPGHHYGPSVDGYEYSAWGTYHRSDCFGIGVDRTIKNGTGYAGRYHKENAKMYNCIETCPEELLLFFHHVPYKHRLKSGKTLIQYIYDTHFEGVEQVKKFREGWLRLDNHIDNDRFRQVLERLEMQIVNAKEWCDVVNSYFFRKTGIMDEHNRTIY